MKTAPSGCYHTVRTVKGIMDSRMWTHFFLVLGVQDEEETKCEDEDS